MQCSRKDAPIKIDMFLAMVNNLTRQHSDEIKLEMREQMDKKLEEHKIEADK